jgi:hypothetical protein
MAIAKGVYKKLSFIKESTWGTRPVDSSTWKYLRRVTSDLDIDKDTYQSAEINSHMQLATFAHGGRRVTGSINGELSPGTYEKFMAAALRKDMVSVATINMAAATLAVGAPSSGVSTITRSAGNWYTDGVRIGEVLKITAGLSTNVNKLFVVVGMTSATVISVMGINALSAPATESAAASGVVTFPGKCTWVPATAHTSDSFSFEHWFSDIAQSECFTGCVVNTMEIGLPATGIATCNTSFLGKDITTATSQFSATSSAATSTSGLTAVNGILRVGSATVGSVPGASISINGKASTEPVVGSNYSPEVFRGNVSVTGQLQAFFEDATLRDAFLNETETGVLLAMCTANSLTADFMTFTMPRVKLGGVRKNDGQIGLQLTIPFTALYATGGAATNGNEDTTLLIHDSAVS